MWANIGNFAALLTLVLVGLAGVFLTVLQLPGTWLIVIAAGAYTWIQGPAELPWVIVLVLAGIAAIAELVEFASSAVLAKRGGASRRAAWYGLAGGMLGALLLSVPIPIIGTVVGAVIGCFGAAFIAEMQEGRTLRAGARSGAYSAAGRALGSMMKLMAAVTMFSIVAVAAVMRLWR
ncbi:MAG TPA: DUF456 domain-containing protein [Phycisphaerae bacterium]|nr:DUF456 domain-containing protein [Phycisphaerae bacterium]